MSREPGKLIVALDVDSFEKMRKLVDSLSPSVDIFKVGSQLFTTCGPAAVRFILARGKKVFLDLKYHDIPNTVAHAVNSAVGLGNVILPASERQEEAACDVQKSIFMYTLHIQGGKKMLEAAVEAARKSAQQLGVEKPLAVGITVLTSDEKKSDLKEIVVERATIAKEAGCDGVVASVEEAAVLREKFGDRFIIVTPGIRPAGADAGDQKRIATPRQAIANGSDFLVVGRPIVEAENPLEAAKKILEEVEI